MTLTWPLSLLALVVVAAVALWALLRPGRHVAVVGSLELWRRAAAALALAPRKRTRRLSAAWAVLLAAATLAACALARPLWHGAAPARALSISLYPSAELAGDGLLALRQAAGALLDRLAPADRVLLVLPIESGQDVSWLSPAQVKARLAEVAPVPLPAASLHMPPAEGVDHEYVFAPANLELAGGPRKTIVPIGASLAPAGFDAMAAVPLPGGKAQALAAVRNRTNVPMTVRLAWSGDGQTHRTELALGANERVVQVRDFASPARIEAALWAADGAPLDRGVLLRREGGLRRVAMTGRDEPLVRRALAADDTVELVAQQHQADFVVAIGAGAPADKPALVIDPPSPPEGYSPGPPLSNVLLSSAAGAGDDPLLAHADLSGVAVRRVAPWRGQGLVSVLSLDGGGVVLRDSGQGPRRVYVAFSVDPDNSTLAMSDAMVVLLANVTRYLAPRQQERYEMDAPAIETGPRGAVTVNLPGLEARAPAQAPRAAVDKAPLPAARNAAGMELWPLLAILSGVLWLAGWALRLRGS
jgi:hypothetical protein